MQAWIIKFVLPDLRMFSNIISYQAVEDRVGEMGVYVGGLRAIHSARHSQPHERVANERGSKGSGSER
jgi:hypothetical protein